MQSSPDYLANTFDADVSKTCVELGMGIAVLARIAFDPARDRSLAAMNADHLFFTGLMNLRTGSVERYSSLQEWGR